jgi:peptidyl-prolyl cis-trans isomerase SurA
MSLQFNERGSSMHKLIGGILVILLAHGILEARTVDRILVKVNEEIITLSELTREMAPARKDLSGKYSGAKLEQELQKAEKQMLDGMIEDKLIYQKAVELEYPANAGEKVDAYIQDLIKGNNLKSTDELEEALAREGTSLEEYRKMIERRMISQALVNDFIGAKISLLTPEIEKYYQNHIAEYTTPEEVTLSEIIISKTDGSPEAENRANDIYSQIQKGGSFTALANQYSKGTTANKGGGIGTYLLEKLNPDTIKAISSLKESEASKPQKIAEGFIIYRLDMRKPAIVQSFEEAKESIKQKLYNEKRDPEYDRFIQQLKEDAYIQIFPEMK